MQKYELISWEAINIEHKTVNIEPKCLYLLILLFNEVFREQAELFLEALSEVAGRAESYHVAHLVDA